MGAGGCCMCGCGVGLGPGGAWVLGGGVESDDSSLYHQSVMVNKR